jgi:hypothetical protein
MKDAPTMWKSQFSRSAARLATIAVLAATSAARGAQSTAKDERTGLLATGSLGAGAAYDFFGARLEAPFTSGLQLWPDFSLGIGIILW